MSHTKNEPANNTDTKENKQPEPVPSQTSDKANKKPRQSSRWPWFALAFIAGSAISFYAPQKYPQILSFLPSSAAQQRQVPAELPTTPNPTPATEVIQAKPIVNSTAMSSEEGKVLINSMNSLYEEMQSLQNELEILRQQQSQVQQTQSSIESMQLHSRLTWITSPASHLPQIQLAWQEILLLPSLTAEQRQQAEDMFQLAQQRVQNIHQWQQELEHLAASFNIQKANNIIPESLDEPNNPWLQWLSQQFSLKRTQNHETLALQKLKSTLTRIQRSLAIEQWPNAKAWTKLRAELQLRVLKSAPQNSEPPKLQLPDHFDTIQADMISLRATAEQWLKEQ